jgi:hypothetical protein
MGICIYMEDLKMSNQFNRLWHEILGTAPRIKLTAFFVKVNIYLLSDELPQKMIPYCINKSK